MNLADDPEAFFSALYSAFNARDVAKVLATLSPDVEWANGWEGGYVTGRQAVEDYWRRQWAELDPTVVPLGVVVSAGHYAVTVDQIVRDLDGNVVHQGQVVHRFTTERGLISRMEIHQLP